MMRIAIILILFPIVLNAQYYKRHAGTLSPTYKVLSEGGSTVENDTIYFVALAGQSNMVGRDTTGNLPAAYEYLRDTIDNAFLVRRESGVIVKYPLLGDNPIFLAGGGYEMGPELLLGDTIKTVVSHNVYLVKIVQGNTFLEEQVSSNDWAVNSKELYSSLFRSINDLTNDSLGLGLPFKCVAVVWHQGENDGTDATAASNYQTNLEEFIDSLRLEVGDSDLPFIIGETTGQTFVSDVDTGKQNIAERILNTSNSFSTTTGTRTNTWYYETSDYVKFDGTHYNATWQLEHARDIFRCLMDANVFSN
jgi:hypothetical protein